MISANVDMEEMEKIDMLTESLRRFNDQISLSIGLCAELEAGIESLIGRMEQLRTESEETAAVLPQ